MTFTRLALVSAIALASAAHAQEGTYITAGIGHVDNEIFDDLKTSAGKSVRGSYTSELSVGHFLMDNLSAELSLVGESPFQSETRPDITQVRLGGFFFMGQDALKPYLTAGLGYEEFDVPNEKQADDEVYMMNFGLGLQYDFSQNVFGRTELRVDNMFDASFEHGVFMLELGYRLGQVSAPVAKPVVQKIVKPEPVVAPKPVVKPEPKPVPVVIKPKDSDNDGVIDELDNCADTFAGASVNEKGCAVFQGTLKGVNFESGSARLTSASRTILDNAAAELVKYPTLNVLVEAYTDSQGSARFNQSLSQKRAESVRSYLIGKGVDANNLKATGFGEAKPVASNDTAKGRAENRRVELSVIK